jgi:hypothetical protein
VGVNTELGIFEPLWGGMSLEGIPGREVRGGHEEVSLFYELIILLSIVKLSADFRNGSSGLGIFLGRLLFLEVKNPFNPF